MKQEQNNITIKYMENRKTSMQELFDNLETLEEAIEKYTEIYRCPATNTDEYCKHDIISAINFGAKWRQQNSYSEEDIENIWNEFVKELPPINNGASSDFLVYLKQFKKK
jgi:undecaprenyl pyrophosphate synthase